MILPTIGSKSWLKAIEEAVKSPNFKVTKKPNITLNPFKNDSENWHRFNTAQLLLLGCYNKSIK